MSLTGKNIVQYSNSCCKAKGLTWVWVVKFSGISSSSGEVQVRQQVAPGPHCSATEIPALEAMAMTSLKPKLPKGLQHMVGGRTPEELLSAQLYQLGVFDQKNNTCNWKPAHLLNNYTSINNLSVSGKMVLWIIINCGVDLVQLTNDTDTATRLPSVFDALLQFQTSSWLSPWLEVCTLSANKLNVRIPEGSPMASLGPPLWHRREDFLCTCSRQCLISGVEPALQWFCWALQLKTL